MSKESREQDAHCQSRANLSLLLCTDGNRRQSIIVKGPGLSGKVEGVGVVDGVVVDGADVVVVGGGWTSSVGLLELCKSCPSW